MVNESKFSGVIFNTAQPILACLWMEGRMLFLLQPELKGCTCFASAKYFIEQLLQIKTALQ